MAVAATVSVGDTAAPSTKAAGHPSSGATAWATAATPAMVSPTRGTARRPTVRAWALSRRGDALQAAACTSGGMKTRRITLGLDLEHGHAGR